VFVAVLPPCPGSREKCAAEVLLPPLIPDGRKAILGRPGIHNGDGDRRAMDAAATLALRHPLNAVATCLAVKFAGAFPGDFDSNSLIAVARVRRPVRASFSSLAVSQAQICLRQFGCEQARVGSAFSGPDFDCSLIHSSSPQVTVHQKVRRTDFVNDAWEQEAGPYGCRTAS
jgi:hypothetical protein